MEKSSLVAKLVRVMANIERVEKNGRNDFHKYDYVTESDVMDAVRKHLIKENVFILSSVEMSQKDGDTVSVSMKHTLIDGDTGDKLEAKSLGIGQDKGDKAANKAVTAACKYFLLKTFLIGTGDDPEATDENGKSTRTVVRAVAAGDNKPVKKYGFSAKTAPSAAPVKVEETSATDEF